MLESHLKNETDMIAELSEMISDLEKNEQEKTEHSRINLPKLSYRRNRSRWTKKRFSDFTLQ